MTKKVTKVNAEKALTRKEMRDALLGHAPEPETKLIDLFGISLELRQPSLGAILDAKDTEDSKVSSTNMIIKYACVPGSDEQVFEEADREMILNWPFGKDMVALQEAITELTGIDTTSATEDLQTDPLKEQS